jgi:hypothetical protein
MLHPCQPFCEKHSNMQAISFMRIRMFNDISIILPGYSAK